MKLLVIAKWRLRGRAEETIRELVGSGTEIVFTGVDPFKRFETEDYTKTMLRQLRDDFAVNETQRAERDGILVLGNEALFVVTGHSGIMEWRGKEQEVYGIPVTASVSPAAIDRNPSYEALLRADVKAIIRRMRGSGPEPGVLPHTIRIARDRDTLKALLEDVRGADAVAFDLETKSFDELADDAFVVTLALTTHNQSTGVDTCWAVPLCHRASPFKNQWQVVLCKIAEAMRGVPVRIAHNAKFDCRWMVRFGAGVPVNFDTMLAHHVMQENGKHGLKHLAPVLLNAPAWDIYIKGGKRAKPWYEQHPLKKILRYNGLDTWHTMKLYHRFAAELEEQPLAKRLFEKLVMPASQSLVYIEQRGVYVDPEKLAESTRLVNETLERIENQLVTFVPADAPYDVNWNPSNFLRWLLFEYLELPVYLKGKTGPSVSESVMMKLTDEGYPIAKLLLERVKWQKFRSGFIVPYNELLTEQSRLHTTFKLHGTVTGRLSSGKPDEDKVTGATKGSLRGVNLQQVPRDPVIRGVFGAEPGWTFVEADYSQVELRVAAEIAREPTMLGLYARGQDIHMAMAMRMTGKPAEQVTKEERKKAKAVNFGFLYGMGWKKFIDTAYTNYNLVVTEREAQAFRKAFFEQFPQLVYWHARQRRLAHRYGRVQSPLGRIRHLPDIYSRDESVVADAERQAINSPVQATASDMCLLSLVILDRKFRREGMSASPIGTVHDAINFEVPNEELEYALPMIKEVMENLPTKKLFGYEFKVPIIADVAIGKHWGHKQEIPGDIVASPVELRKWLNG